jgi:protocatechuate 3,4-dioxygenase beta subunit
MLPTLPGMTTRFNRRRALAGLGSVSLAALLAACGDEEEQAATTTAEQTPSTATERFDDTSSCTLTAEQTEGPYYFDADAVRSDVRDGRPGTTLNLAVRVRDDQCKPIRNAIVDLWHCDAGGVYSGFDEGEGERFLRGTQPTDKDGIAEFTTVYPGAYQGRTVHIHAKVHLDNTTVLTTQLYFDDAFTDKVYASAPYESGDRTRNDSDGIFDESLRLKLARKGNEVDGSISFDVRRA